MDLWPGQSPEALNQTEPYQKPKRASLDTSSEMLNSSGGLALGSPICDLVIGIRHYAFDTKLKAPETRVGSDTYMAILYEDS